MHNGKVRASKRPVGIASSCLLAAGLVMMPVAALAADGPGYGGNANQLTVTWVKPKSNPTPNPTGTPSPTSSSSSTPTPTPTQPSSGGKSSKTEPPTPEDVEPEQAKPSQGKSAKSEAATRQSPRESQPATSSGRSTSTIMRLALLPGSAVIQPAALVAADQPVVSGEAQEYSLAIAGVGFESGAKVAVQIGDILRRDVNASVIGALNLDVPGIQLTSSQPGQTIVATGPGPSGTPIVLTGSIPPVPSPGGPIVIATWLIAGIGALWMGRWVWRRYGNGKDPADDQSADEGAKETSAA